MMISMMMMVMMVMYDDDLLPVDLRDSAGRGELRVGSDLERGAVATRSPRHQMRHQLHQQTNVRRRARSTRGGALGT